ncbi:MAG: FG-GAP-like repeat-containing protein [Acidimicrobiales bacterium]
MFRRLVSVVGVVAVVTGVLVASPAAAGGPYSKDWATLLPGWNRSSSPVIADIDADGQNEVVFGHQDGRVRAYEGNGTLKWSTAAVPSLAGGCRAQGTGSAVDSSPAVADIDEDGTPEVIVGVGSTWVSGQNGGVVVFNGKTGAKEWGTRLGRDEFNVWSGSAAGDGWCEGVFSTPAIGDVNGDGHLDIVFASWDFYIWAVDRHGNPLPGFPFNNDDTVWSSPALFDVNGDGDMEIFIGGDTTPGGYYDHLGGVFRALDWRPSGVVNLWNANANEVFHSSPAIGDIDGDGRPEAVVGTGGNWFQECGAGHPQCQPGDGSDHTKVFAFHLDDGSRVPGFPVSTGGTVIGSPALGDVDKDGKLEVVIGSDDHWVYAWNGDGSLAWRVRPTFDHLGSGRMSGSPVIGDLDGDGDQDVAIGGSNGLALLDGRTGANLESGLSWTAKASFAWSHEAAPAIGVLNGSRRLVFTGFDTPGNRTRVASYRLPGSSAVDAWPMFRHGVTRQGVAPGTAPCGFSTSGTFCDVSPSAYYASAVSWMVAEDITTGVSDLLYGPDQWLSRAQMVTFLWRAEGSPKGNPSHGFADVPANAYYAEAVRWAKATGITTGTSRSTFSPDDPVTRGQLVTLLWRRAGTPSAPFPSEFHDVVRGTYYATAVGWAKVNGITTGTSAHTFAPAAPVTRGQAAAFLYREAGSPAV